MADSASGAGYATFRPRTVPAVKPPWTVSRIPAHSIRQRTPALRAAAQCRLSPSRKRQQSPERCHMERSRAKRSMTRAGWQTSASASPPPPPSPLVCRRRHVEWSSLSGTVLSLFPVATHKPLFFSPRQAPSLFRDATRHTTLLFTFSPESVKRRDRRDGTADGTPAIFYERPCPAGNAKSSSKQTKSET